MVIVSVDMGGSVTLYNLALTNLWPRLFALLKLRHDFGMFSPSSSLGVIRDLSCLTSRSGVYVSTMKVSYGQGSFWLGFLSSEKEQMLILLVLV